MHDHKFVLHFCPKILPTNWETMIYEGLVREFNARHVKAPRAIESLSNGPGAKSDVGLQSSAVTSLSSNHPHELTLARSLQGASNQNAQMHTRIPPGVVENSAFQKQARFTKNPLERVRMTG